LAQGKIDHAGAVESKEKREAVLKVSLPASICANLELFAKPLRSRHLSGAANTSAPNLKGLDQCPPFQPCTWFQLVMNVCFTASGNAT
jgi:hypothetical protein